jgi:hypothetical protein
MAIVEKYERVISYLYPIAQSMPRKHGVANFIKHKDLDGLSRFTASWRGHTQWANAHNLTTWMESRYGITF